MVRAKPATGLCERELLRCNGSALPCRQPHAPGSVAAQPAQCTLRRHPSRSASLSLQATLTTPGPRTARCAGEWTPPPSPACLWG